MKICMIVNNVLTEGKHYTTTLLAQKMHNKKHEVWYIGIDDLSYTEGFVGGMATRADDKTFRSTASYLENIRKNYPQRKKILAKDLDIFLLRNDPAEEDKTRSWAKVAGISFGQLATEEGVMVLNDAYGMSNALNKTYIQQFPREIQAETIISRDKKDIKDFFEANNKNIIVKPLSGSSGKSVFQVREHNIKNLNQMIEAITQDGYVIAQEFLPESDKGDTRVFLLNGKIMTYKGKYAAIQRVNASGDIRSNLHAGGEANNAQITDDIHRIVEIVRPNLIRDGMFFVGLDIIKDKLLEINVYSPGGLYSACNLNDRDFTIPLIESLEHKLYLKDIYQGNIENWMLATM